MGQIGCPIFGTNIESADNEIKKLTRNKKHALSRKASYRIHTPIGSGIALRVTTSWRVANHGEHQCIACGSYFKGFWVFCC
jgi:hypothetical protein